MFLVTVVTILSVAIGILATPEPGNFLGLGNIEYFEGVGWTIGDHRRAIRGPSGTGGSVNARRALFPDGDNSLTSLKHIYQRSILVRNF